MTVVREELGEATGYELITPSGVTGITSTLITPTSGIYKGFPAKAVLITVEAYAVRFRCDGSDPSATTGHVIAKDDSYILVGTPNLTNLRFRDTGTGASNVLVTVFH